MPPSSPSLDRLVLACLLSLVALSVPDAAWAQAIGGLGGAADPVATGTFYLNVFLALCALALIAAWVYIGFTLFRPGGAPIFGLVGAAAGTIVIICAAYFANAGGGGGAVAL